MSAPRFEDLIRDFIVASLPEPVPIADEDRLLDRGYIPSLQLISLVGFLEDRFHIVVNPFDVQPENFESIARIAEFVRDQGGHL